jgi:hypothetical protein
MYPHCCPPPIQLPPWLRTRYLPHLLLLLLLLLALLPLRLLDFGPLDRSIAYTTALSSPSARRRLCTSLPPLPPLPHPAAAPVPPAPRVAIVLVFGGDWGAWAGPLAEHNVREYARRHGYSVVRAEVDPTRPVAWSKLSGVRRALDHFDLVMYLDSDMLVGGRGGWGWGEGGREGGGGSGAWEKGKWGLRRR